jgi:hypothetical protein
MEMEILTETTMVTQKQTESQREKMMGTPMPMATQMPRETGMGSLKAKQMERLTEIPMDLCSAIQKATYSVKEREMPTQTEIAREMTTETLRAIPQKSPAANMDPCLCPAR